jgi:hypothetical protein
MDGNEKPHTLDQRHQQQQGLFLTVYPKGKQPWSSAVFLNLFLYAEPFVPPKNLAEPLKPSIFFFFEEPLYIVILLICSKSLKFKPHFKSSSQL